MEQDMERMTVFPGDEDEPLLPDGWSEGEDLFAEEESISDVLEPDGAGQEETEEPEDGEEHAADGGPTTAGQDGAEGQSGGDEPAPEEPDGEPEDAQKTPRILKLKVNHTEEDVDVDAMSDEELAALMQKGRAFDALKDAEGKRRFRQVYQEQLDAGMTEAAAKLIAQNEANGKAYPLTDEEEAQQAPDAPAKEEPGIRDFRAEVEQLKALYPEFGEVPDEVAKAAARGVPLLSAYLAYRDKQSAKTAASLRRENEVLKQNAAAAAKAPVRGVSGGGAAQKKPDPFLKGFDADPW